MTTLHATINNQSVDVSLSRVDVARLQEAVGGVDISKLGHISLTQDSVVIGDHDICPQSQYIVSQSGMKKIHQTYSRLEGGLLMDDRCLPVSKYKSEAVSLPAASAEVYTQARTLLESFVSRQAESKAQGAETQQQSTLDVIMSSYMKAKAEGLF
ncbi:MAG: hypothetical protein ABII18_12860 [bacterium]|nr:hypothetical protein [bacterium]MBU1917267.1 hypothetical protein [bacterium]